MQTEACRVWYVALGFFFAICLSIAYPYREYAGMSARNCLEMASQLFPDFLAATFASVRSLLMFFLIGIVLKHTWMIQTGIKLTKHLLLQRSSHFEMTALGIKWLVIQVSRWHIVNYIPGKLHQAWEKALGRCDNAFWRTFSRISTHCPDLLFWNLQYTFIVKYTWLIDCLSYTQ